MFSFAIRLVGCLVITAQVRVMRLRLTTCLVFNGAATTKLALQIRTLTDGGAGMMAQTTGLAQEISALSGGEITRATVRPLALTRLLPPALVAGLGIAAAMDLDLDSPSSPPATTAPAPEIIIGCGGNAQAAVLAMKKKHGAFAVCIQRPFANEKSFDAIVAPTHDYSDSEVAAIEKSAQSNIILTTGAVGLHSPKKLAAAREVARQRFAAFSPPYIAVLLGGENRAYQINTAQIVAQLSEVAKQSGATFLLTTSRRSSGDLLPALTAAFGEAHYIWDGRGDNPYADILASADGFCITCDSVNMISESCASGKAVFLLPLTKKSSWRAARATKKFARFHAALVARHLACWWENEWAWNTSPPLMETERAAADLFAMFSRRPKK